MNQPWVYMCSPSRPSLPPPSPSHPSGSSQRTSPEHPVSCIEPRLAICFTYDNIHVSVLFSQILPPLRSPTESKSLFFTCAIEKESTFMNSNFKSPPLFWKGVTSFHSPLAFHLLFATRSPGVSPTQSPGVTQVYLG